MIGYENGEILLNEIYRFREIEEKDGRIRGEWVRIGELQHKEKMKNAGIAGL